MSRKLPPHTGESNDELGFSDELVNVTSAIVSTDPPAEETAEEVGDDPDDVPDRELGDYQEFFIPVHDFVRFTEDELRIIDHPAFQRLGKVYQLGQSHLVYRGATHKRLEHCLGTLHVAQKIVNAVRATYNRQSRHGTEEPPIENRCAFDKPPTMLETRFIRLAALLHDIGHLPAGHTLEDELCLLESHDGASRIDLVFGKSDWIPGFRSETLETVINDRYNKYLKKGSKGPRKSASDIVKLIICKDALPTKVTNEIRVSVCRDIVGNTICADLLDYLHRDWYHLGKPRFFEKRLFQYMQIRKDARDQTPKFVISYGDYNRPKRDGVSAILQLLESRYNLAEAVLFHPTKCSAAAMLERGISEIYESLPVEERDEWTKQLEARLLLGSDSELLTAFLEEAIERNCGPAVAVLQSLIRRDIYKSVCLVMKDALGPGGYDLLMHKFVTRDELAKANSKAKNSTDGRRRLAADSRRKALAYFESDFSLPAGSIVMYCPPPDMNSKLAEVKIIQAGSIQTLAYWDEDYNLAGGHCKAQMDRFRSLWRVEIFMRKDVRDEHKRDFRILLERAIKLLVLGITENGAQPDHAAFELAKALSAVPGVFENYKVYEQTAAKGETERYPMGAPRLKGFFGV